jgi:hypothetical protein
MQQMDLILACLLILLGAAIANALDERYLFTPRLSAWLDRMMGEF